MAAYLIFIRDKTIDEQELKIYHDGNRATLAGVPIKLLAFYGHQVVLEGPDSEGVVVAEFPAMENALNWYNSPAYQAMAQHRHKGANYRVILIEGLPVKTQEG
jgi:uncharacterized protein (DUF1330 family)